jgi:DNA-binding CsgD family transcriptional regulator
MKRTTGRREGSQRREPGAFLDFTPPAGLSAHRFDVGPDAFGVIVVPLGKPSPSAEAVNLTPSEQSVMQLVLEGKSNQDIAKSRRTAVRTVANQVASIFKKLGVGSRSELYAFVARGKKNGP